MCRENLTVFLQLQRGAGPLTQLINFVPFRKIDHVVGGLPNLRGARRHHGRRGKANQVRRNMHGCEAAKLADVSVESMLGYDPGPFAGEDLNRSARN